MSAEPNLVELDPEREPELALRLERAEASREPVVVAVGVRRYRLVPIDEDDVQTTNDPGADFNPEKTLAAVEASFGAFKGMDVEAFLSEILAARVQDTSRHSF
jgi:hypothetical protein